MVPTLTLSKAALVSEAVVWLVTARPTYGAAPDAATFVLPTAFQVAPSEDLALPATPTAPTSVLVHGAGRLAPPPPPPPPPGGGTAAKFANRSLRSVAFAASPSSGPTPKISCSVRSRELCV